MPEVLTGRARTQFTSEQTIQRNRRFWASLSKEEKSRRQRYSRSFRTHWPKLKSPIADLHALAKLCCPTIVESRAMLIDLIASIGHSHTAAVIGLSPQHLIGLLRSANASPSLRKHVWLVWCLLLRPGAIRTGFTLLTAGRFTPSGPQHAGMAHANH